MRSPLPAARAALLCLAAAQVAAAPLAHAAATSTAAPEIGRPLAPWREGELDIHHINTGRGEASLLILPDGTSLLIDASGKTVEAPPFSLPTRPDASRAPGEWVARHIRRVLPPAREGGYQLSGITEVAEHLPIRKIIDRAWPTYDYPAPLGSRTVENYRRFLTWQQAHRGLQVEQFRPGRNDQLTLARKPGAYPQFEIRNLMANGVVWSGVGSETRNLFPPPTHLAAEDLPIENKLSIALRVSYGPFDYYTGGDLSANGDELLAPARAWQDVETPVARASGPVDVMKANHHGSWDANSAAFLAALRPRAIVIGSRAEGHPAINTYQRMTSQATWPGPRDIFITNVSPATFRTTYNVDKAASTQGHVIVRVSAGGKEYRILMLGDADEDMRVKAVFGPYASR